MAKRRLKGGCYWIAGLHPNPQIAEWHPELNCWWVIGADVNIPDGHIIRVISPALQAPPMIEGSVEDGE